MNQDWKFIITTINNSCCYVFASFNCYLRTISTVGYLVIHTIFREVSNLFTIHKKFCSCTILRFFTWSNEGHFCNSYTLGISFSIHAPSHSLSFNWGKGYMDICTCLNLLIRTVFNFLPVRRSVEWMFWIVWLVVRVVFWRVKFWSHIAF